MANGGKPELNRVGRAYALQALCRKVVEGHQLFTALPQVVHSTLSGWLKKARQQGVQGASRSLTADQQRIKDLEKEIAHLREVNEIVKKAHVYFVNNPSR